MLATSSLQEVPVDLAHVVRESLANELEAQCADVRAELGEAITGPGLGNALRGLLKVELEACSKSLRRKINEDLSSSRTQGSAASQNVVEDMIREQHQILLQLQLHLQKQNAVPKLVVPARSQGSWYSHAHEARAAEVALPGAVESDMLVEEIRQFDDTSSSTRSQPGESRSQENEESSQTKLLRFNDSVVPVVSSSSKLRQQKSTVSESSWEAKKNARRSMTVELTGFMKDGLFALVADDEDGAEVIPDSESVRSRVTRVARRFLEKPAFDGAISFLILLNAISIGAQTNAQLSRSDTTDKIFEVVDKIFYVIFLTELTMRFAAYGLTFFTSKEWQWNFFDAGIVGLQTFETISSAVISDDSNTQGSSFSFLRIMRILRLARIFRIVRLLRFVQELRTMVSSIASSMKSLVWTLVLIIFLMYVSGICVCQAIIYAAMSNSDIFKDDRLNKYYNSLLLAILTLFEAMTGGVNWDDAMRPLMDNVSPWMTVFFCIFIAFSVLAMMNVITGVFVESALQTAKEDKDKDVLLQLQRVFKLADKDGSGSLTWDEFQEQLLTPHTKKVFSSLDIELQEARGLFILLDTDGSGTINCEEFLQGCLQLRGPARAIEMSTLMYYNKRMAKWWSKQLKDLHKSIRSLQEVLEVDSRHLIFEDDTTQAHAYATWAELKSGAYATSAKTDQPDQAG